VQISSRRWSWYEVLCFVIISCNQEKRFTFFHLFWFSVFSQMFAMHKGQIMFTIHKNSLFLFVRESVDKLVQCFEKIVLFLEFAFSIFSMWASINSYCFCTSSLFFFTILAISKFWVFAVWCWRSWNFHHEMRNFCMK